MSRVGKTLIKLPTGVSVQLSGGVVAVKGPKGSLSQKMHDNLKIEINEQEKAMQVLPINPDKNISSQWGLYRVLINNMIIGVTTGFQKVLEIEGIGYKAEMKGKNLMISVGYSHPILFTPPPGVTLGIDGPTKVVISGVDKQVVGQIAAEIRNVRPPEPYKGKGIRYQGEHIIRKAGKTIVK